MAILVTGGAGYIGSHIVRLLTLAGERVVIIDDLTSGIRERVLEIPMIELDLASTQAKYKLTKILLDHEVSTVIHLAARKKVGESFEVPEWYYQQNVGGLENLLTAMEQAAIRKLIFSSSAATYGNPEVLKVDETTACVPINPYGETKLIGERMVGNACRSWGLDAINLRYFNAAGVGWPDLFDKEVANIIPIAIKAVRAGSSPVIFGDDYDTPDGTCIRDYVHVLDLAEAHIVALHSLVNSDSGVRTFNVGTGYGSSVAEVLTKLRAVSKVDFQIQILGRRPGDPSRLVADVGLIRRELGWTARYDLEDILSSAFAIN